MTWPFLKQIVMGFLWLRLDSCSNIPQAVNFPLFIFFGQCSTKVFHKKGSWVPEKLQTSRFWERHESSMYSLIMTFAVLNQNSLTRKQKLGMFYHHGSFSAFLIESSSDNTRTLIDIISVSVFDDIWMFWKSKLGSLDKWHF